MSDELFPNAAPAAKVTSLKMTHEGVWFGKAPQPGTIITVRGTSGSGKSHLARAIMSCYNESTPVFLAGRKRPYYYLLQRHGSTKMLAVLGSYDTDCGGCDTIDKVQTVYDLVKAHAEAGRDVLFEGLLLSGDVIHTKEMGLTNHLLFLNTSLEDCLASVNARRRSKGKTDDVNPDNTAAKHRFCRRGYERAQAEIPNAVAYWVNRDEALVKAKELLGLP